MGGEKGGKCEERQQRERCDKDWEEKENGVELLGFERGFCV